MRLEDFLRLVDSQKHFFEENDLKGLVDVNYSLPMSCPTGCNGEVREIIAAFPKEYRHLQFIMQFYQECSRTFRISDVIAKLRGSGLSGLGTGSLVTFLPVCSLYLVMEGFFVKALAFASENSVTKTREENERYAFLLQRHGERRVDYTDVFKEVERAVNNALYFAKNGKLNPNLERQVESLMEISRACKTDYAEAMTIRSAQAARLHRYG